MQHAMFTTFTRKMIFYKIRYLKTLKIYTRLKCSPPPPSPHPLNNKYMYKRSALHVLKWLHDMMYKHRKTLSKHSLICSLSMNFSFLFLSVKNKSLRPRSLINNRTVIGLPTIFTADQQHV